jgi:hypothetical protein
VFQSSVDVLFGFVCSANHEPEVTAVIQRLWIQKLIVSGDENFQATV